MPTYLALATGMRRSEIFGLQWRDIDFDAGRLRVVRALEQTKTDGLAMKEPKSETSRRSISLDACTVEQLRAHKARQASEALRLGPVYENNDLVCAQLDGSIVNQRTFSKEFRRAAMKAGVKVHLHALRHRHASVMLHNGPSSGKRRTAKATGATSRKPLQHPPSALLAPN